MSRKYSDRRIPLIMCPTARSTDPPSSCFSSFQAFLLPHALPHARDARISFHRPRRPRGEREREAGPRAAIKVWRGYGLKDEGLDINTHGDWERVISRYRVSFEKGTFRLERRQVLFFFFFMIKLRKVS